MSILFLILIGINLFEYSLSSFHQNSSPEVLPQHDKIEIPLLSINRLLGSASTEATSSPHYLKLDLAKELAIIQLNLIHQRFEFDTPRLQFLLVANNMPTTAWEILKFKFAIKYLEGGDNSAFKMIFGGSSVTAGHDNKYNQSYPFVMERRLKPLFDALGMTLLVHNIAHGANRCRPSNFCYEAMGGDSPDWIGNVVFN